MRGSWRGTPALVCADEQPCRRALWLNFSRSAFGRTLIIMWIVLVGVGVFAALTGCGPKKDKQPSTEVTCEPAAEGQLQVCWNVKVHR